MGSRFSKNKKNKTKWIKPINKAKDRVLIRQLSPPSRPMPTPSAPNVPPIEYFGSTDINIQNAKHTMYEPDSYRPQPGFNNRILLYGFMRDIESNLNGVSAMRIIPDTIMRICDMYYSTPNIIFYFESQHAQSNTMRIVDLDDMDREIHKKHIFSYPKTEQNGIESAGLYHQSRIKLPQHIQGTVKSLEFQSDIDYFDVLFKCGGSNGNSTYCCAYIWKADDTYYDNTYQLRLPHYPDEGKSGNGQSIVWSDKQQCLYSISASNLNTFSMNEWKWSSNSLLFNIGRGRSRMGFMSSVIVTNDMYQERLIMIGGAANTGKGVTFCDLYDIEKDEWMEIADMNFARHRAGIYHDKWTQRLFVGGGNGAERKIEYYDMNKNKWYFDKTNIPYTQLKHNVYPIIWNQDGHLLYIASIKANGVEFVDLRQENRQWTVAYDTLDPLFDTKIVWYKAAKCRLIQ